MTTYRVYKTADDKIAVDTVAYKPQVNADLKTLGGCRFHAETKTWRFPMHWEACKHIRAVATKHGDTLKIYPSLAEWARIEKARQEGIPDVQAKDFQELPILAATYPETHRAISTRAFQTVGAKFIATNRNALIADEPGLGKTLQTIAAVVESETRGPILVIGPKAAVGITWPAEVERWAPGERVIVINADMNPAERKQAIDNAIGHSGNEESGRIWICANPAYIRRRVKLDAYKNIAKEKGKPVYEYPVPAMPDFFTEEYAAVIVDESHLTLAGCTGNVKKQSAQRQGLGSLKIRKNGMRVAMSGTPFRGKEEYIWGQLNWLRPDLFTSYWKWVEKHFIVENDGFGMVVGAIKSKADMYAEARSVMLRRTKAEVAPDLPPKVYAGRPLDPSDKNSPIAVWLPMLPKQAKQYKQMVDDGVAELKGGVIMANGTLPEITRLRQLACGCGKITGDESKFGFTGESNKIDYLVELLDNYGINKDMLTLTTKKGVDPREHRRDIAKVVVASQFKELLFAVKDVLTKHMISVHMFTGDTTEKNKKAIKKDWQENDTSSTRVMLLQLQAGGTSLTLDAADYIVTMDEAWSKDDEQQVEDRIHRLSNMHQVIHYRLRSLETLEEGYARNTTETAKGIRGVIDGQRGVKVKEILLGKKVIDA